MALGDAMFGLGIGLQGQAKLNMNAPMQAVKQRQAAKAAKDKKLSDDINELMKDFGDFKGLHNFYLPLAKEEVYNAWTKIDDIISKGDENAKNQVLKIIKLEVTPTIESFKNSSNLLFGLEKNPKILTPDGFNEVIRNSGDVSGLEKLQPQLSNLGIEYNPQTRTLQTIKEYTEVNLFSEMEKVLDPATATDYDTPIKLAKPGGGYAFRYNLTIPKEIRASSFDGLMDSNINFKKTFERNYGLTGTDPTTPEYQAAKDDFIEKSKTLRASTQTTNKPPSNYYNFGGGAQQMQVSMAADESISMPSTGNVNISGMPESTGELVVNQQGIRPFSLGRIGDQTTGAFTISAKDVFKMDDPYSSATAVPGLGGAGKLSNSKVNATGNIEFKEATAYPGFVTNKDVTIKVDAGLGRTQDVVVSKGTIITSWLDGYLSAGDKKKATIVTGQSVTDPYGDPSIAYSAGFVLTRDLLSQMISTLSGWKIDSGGNITPAGDPKSAGYQKAKSLVDMYNESSKKMENGGLMGGISLDQYISLPASERLNYIRTIDGNYKKK
jgi:hypothetical protein